MIRLHAHELGLWMAFGAAAACQRDDGGSSVDTTKIDAFTEAACRCWDLVNLGDVYFGSREECLHTAGAFALGFPFNETECTVDVIQSIPQARDELSCHVDTMGDAVACFEAIESCDYMPDDGWNTCFLIGAGWYTCDMIPFEPVYEQLYPACSYYG